MATTNIFIAFDARSGKDKKYFRDLKGHLELLGSLGVTLWDETRVAPGEDWAREILQHLQSTDLVLLLVSTDFLNSSIYVTDTKIAELLQRYVNTERAVPIILRSVLWEHSRFSHLNPLPRGGEALSLCRDIDAAYTEIVREVSQIVKRLQAATATFTTSSSQTASNGGSGAVQGRPPTPVVLQNSVIDDDLEEYFDQRRAKNDYDAFLCYNRKDEVAVKDLAQKLMQQRILPWLDQWEIRPGLLWQTELDRQMRNENIKAAVVCVGQDGIGPWQNRELQAFIARFVNGDHPVIPVILPGCLQAPSLPVFLDQSHYIDFNQPGSNPLEYLIWGITNKRPRGMR